VRAGLDIDAFEAWLSGVPLREVPADRRVTELGS